MVKSYYMASRNLKNVKLDSLALEVNVYPAAAQKANEVVRKMANNAEEELNYYFKLKPQFRALIQDDLQRAFYMMQELSSISGQFGEKALSDDVARRLNDIVKVYQPELATPESKK